MVTRPFAGAPERSITERILPTAVRVFAPLAEAGLERTWAGLYGTVDVSSLSLERFTTGDLVTEAHVV